MSKRTLLNLLLIACVAVLATVAILEPGRDKPEDPTLVSTLDASTIESIRIKRANQDAIVLAKNADKWLMLEPLAIAANGYRLEKLLAVTGARSLSRFNVSAVSVSELDLDPPRATLVLDGKIFAFGKTDSIDQRRYLQIDDTIHLITDRYYHHMIAGWLDFVSRSLLPDDIALTSIELPDLLLRRDNGNWQTTPTELDMDAINFWVDAWQSAQAINLRKLPEIPEHADVVRIGLADGGVIEFRVIRGDKTAGTLLARPDVGIAYVIADDAAQSLLRPTRTTPEPEVDAAD